MQKNLLIIQTYPRIKGGLGYVYDIRQPFENMFRGAYFRVHSEDSDWLILPKLNLLYFYSHVTNMPYKVIYDIMTPPIYKVSSMFKPYVKVLAYLYVTLD